jgi:hypothetical protein
MDLASINSVLDQVMTAVVSAATNSAMVGALNSEGVALLAALLGCMITYHLVMAALGDDMGSVIASIFNLFLKWAIVMVLLAGWGPIVGNLFGSGFNQLAAKIPNAGGTAQVLDLGVNSMKALFNLGEKDANGVPCPPDHKDCKNPATATDKEESGNALTRAIAYMGDALSNAAWDVVAFAIKCVAAVFVAFMLVAFIVISLIGVFMLGIGLATGPILLPLLLLPGFDGIFFGWFRFMLTGGLIKIVAAVVISMVTGIFMALNNLSASVNNSTSLGVDIMALLLMVIMAAVGAHIMGMVPDFAGQLIAGGGGAGARGFGRTGASGAGKSAVKSAGGAIAGGIGGLARGLAGGKSGPKPASPQIGGGLSAADRARELN